jgi:hypothetical protein
MFASWEAMRSPSLTFQGLVVTSVTKGGTQKLSKKFRLLKPTDMTIRWKALEEHFLMVPSDSTIFGIFLKKISVLEVRVDAVCEFF